MKRLYLIALFSLALLFAGCGTYTVAPGADPARYPFYAKPLPDAPKP